MIVVSMSPSWKALLVRLGYHVVLCMACAKNPWPDPRRYSRISPAPLLRVPSSERQIQILVAVLERFTVGRRCIPREEKQRIFGGARKIQAGVNQP